MIFEVFIITWIVYAWIDGWVGLWRGRDVGMSGRYSQEGYEGSLFVVFGVGSCISLPPFCFV